MKCNAERGYLQGLLKLYFSGLTFFISNHSTTNKYGKLDIAYKVTSTQKVFVHIIMIFQGKKNVPAFSSLRIIASQDKQTIFLIEIRRERCQGLL